MKNQEIPQDAISALEQGRVVEAVKILRREKGLSLPEAKDQIDSFIAQNPELKVKFANNRQFTIESAIIGLLIALLLIWYFFLR